MNQTEYRQITERRYMYTNNSQLPVLIVRLDSEGDKKKNPAGHYF